MRKEPHWVKLFLRELERTGNVRISAERAGVDYTSAYQRRKRHGEFAEKWEASLAAFRATPSPQPLSREGERDYGGITVTVTELPLDHGLGGITVTVTELPLDHGLAP